MQQPQDPRNSGQGPRTSESPYPKRQTPAEGSETDTKHKASEIEPKFPNEFEGDETDDMRTTRHSSSEDHPNK